jgi:5'-3' exonuclease
LQGETRVSPLLLVDLSGLFWRHYHASGSGPQAYESTLEALTEMVEFYPRMVICCEGRRPIRYDWFPEYKANRTEKPEDAVESLRRIIGELKTCPPPVVAIDGYEADDVIATLATQSSEPVCILSQDKDLYQLLSEKVSMIVNDRRIGPPDCIVKFGVRPEQMRDYLAIVGDSSDNIPGCPGTGAKGAARLLAKFHTLDAARAASDEDLNLKPKALEKFRAWDPSLALKLVTLLRDAPIHLNQLFPNESETDMADMTKIVTERKGGPLKIVTYGPEGVGKTRFGAFSTKPIFLCAESGLSAPDLKDIPAFPAIDTWADVFGAIEHLKTAEHAYRTLVVDSLDWLHPYAKAHVIAVNKMDASGYDDYGRGEKFAFDEWVKLMGALDELQSAKGMHVIVLAHSGAEVFQNPQGEDFARYQLALSKKAADRWKQWPDFLLFMSQEVFTKKTKNEKSSKGIIGGHRIYTDRTAAFDAKNRVNLPSEIEYETANPFAPFAQAVKEAMAKGRPAKADPASAKSATEAA